MPHLFVEIALQTALMMANRRPLGVTIIAILVAIGAILCMNYPAYKSISKSASCGHFIYHYI